MLISLSRALEQNPSTHSTERSLVANLSPAFNGAVDELLDVLFKDEAGDGSARNMSFGPEEGEYGRVECLSR